MAGLNLLMNPQSLTQEGQVPLHLLNDAYNWRQRAQQADQIGLAELAAEQAQQQRMRPMMLEKQRIANDTSLAELPGVQADTRMKVRKDKGEEITFDAATKQALRDIAIKGTESDIKEVEQRAQQLMYSMNPKEQAEGKKLFMASKHMVEEREKHRMELAKSGQAQASAKELLQMQIDAGRFKKGGGKSEMEIVSKMGFEKAAVYYEALADNADNEGETAAAQQYRMKADMYAKKWQEGKQAAQVPKPGGVDIQAATGGQVPTQPIPAATGLNRGTDKPTGKINEDWVSRAIKANPNMTREDVIKMGEQLKKW